MTFDQAAILTLLVGMLAAFAIDRIRMEIVALGGLAIGVFLGLVPAEGAFHGFASPAFLTVVEVLLIAQVLGHSGLLDRLAARIPATGMGEIGLVAILCLITAFISVFMNNIGALALMLPVIYSVCRVSGFDQRRMLMPVSFAALLGGLCSIIGTPANLIVSQQLASRTGHGFAFFDFAYVGVPAALAGLAVLVLWTRRVFTPEDRRRVPLPGHSFRRIVTEVLVPKGSELDGAAVDRFPATIHAMHRDGRHIMFQRPGTSIAAGDVLLIESDLSKLETWLSERKLVLPHGSPATGGGWVEAVVMPESTIVGSRVQTLETFFSRGIQIVAVAAQTPRIEGSLADLQLSIGDVLFLKGEEEALREAFDEAEMLPLWPRLAKPSVEKPWLPVIAFVAGIALTAFGYASPELAFGLVVLFLAAVGALNLRRALADLDWPILIMLAAMIPLGAAVESTGAAAIMAGNLISILPADNPLLLVGAILALAVAVTPFVNNASTAIVLGPVAIGLADAAGLPPEPFLIAVALGASIDFLTPIGHHNNTVVMGLAGYRFTDFFKAGWPVTLVVFLFALCALWLFWI